MKELKFKIYYGIDGEDDTYHSNVYTFGEIENRIHTEWLTEDMLMEGYSIIATSQYTGLKDKNSKEIYEGDIVKFHQFTQEIGENLGVSEGEKEFNAQVGFDNAGITINDEPLFMYYGTHEESIEVIGNIYKNPELI